MAASPIIPAIAGAGSRTPIREVQRLVDTYGGNAEDWAKLSSPRYTFPDGTQMDIHRYKNLTTGENLEYKAKLLGTGIQPMGADD